MNQSAATARIALLQFPGSNCDQDCIDVFSRHYNKELIRVPYTAAALPEVDAVIIPGGFSYGDYLRAGALASAAPVMTSVQNFARAGGAILGICNGFQILTEARLLPGVLLPNQKGDFICKQTHLQVAAGSTGYHRYLQGRAGLNIPIAHAEGRYFADKADLAELAQNGAVLLRYARAKGDLAEPEFNPNGSTDHIAGITSKDGRILGMMPHPERATDRLLGGSDDGLAVLDAFMTSIH